jgi:hypothetical protein
MSVRSKTPVGDWHLPALDDHSPGAATRNCAERLGDGSVRGPAYDFAQCRQMIPEIVADGRRLWGLPEGLAYDAERTGTEVSPQRVAYYREIYGLLQLAYARHVASLVRGLDCAPLRFVRTATEVAFRSFASLGFLPAT